MNPCLLVINVAPEQEDDLVDYLLAHPAAPGFTSYAAHGHSQAHPMSIAEQVRGKRRRQQFELLADASTASEIIDGLVDAVGKGALYWQQPVIRSGRT